MQLTDPIYTANMNDHQRAWFYAEYQRASKDETIGVLLAFFLGVFGIHHFYLRRNDLGIIYLLLFWTGITAIVAFVECFFMPGRVRQYNRIQAMHISSQILASASTSSAHCTSCGSPIASSATFCPHCGAAVATPLSAQPTV